MSEGSSIPTSPAELSDSPTICPPNTPSNSPATEFSSPKLLDETSNIKLIESSLTSSLSQASESSISSKSSEASSFPVSSGSTPSESSTLCSSNSTVVSLSAQNNHSSLSISELVSPSRQSSESECPPVPAPEEGDHTQISTDTDVSSPVEVSPSAEQSDNVSDDSTTEDTTEQSVENNSLPTATEKTENEDLSINEATESSAQSIENHGISNINEPQTQVVDDNTSENSTNVTVKRGYIMVPILTPYYDPNGKFNSSVICIHNNKVLFVPKWMLNGSLIILSVCYLGYFRS